MIFETDGDVVVLSNQSFWVVFSKDLMFYFFIVHVLSPLLWLIIRYFNNFGYSTLGEVFLDLLYVLPITIFVAFGHTKRKIEQEP